MAASYNACSPMTRFSASKESSSVVAYPPSARSPSPPTPVLQSHSTQFNRLLGCSHTLTQSTQCQSYPSAYKLNKYEHYEAATMDHSGLVQTYFSTTPMSSSSFSSSQTSAFSASSPQPSLYQVPPQFRQKNDSLTNGYPEKMAKHGVPFSSAFSPVSPNTQTNVTQPSTSFSFSSRNIRPATYSTTASTVDSNGRFSFSNSRKSSQLSHHTSSRSNKVDILLDRKAFISLEKSINWQAALPCSTSTPLTPPAQHPSPGSCSPLQSPLNSFNSPQGQTYQLNSPRLTQVTNVVQTVSDYSKEDNSSFSPSDGQWNAGNAERDFTLPGMKDVPAWLKLLRLHKYAPFFARMSYEEMLELTEDVLEHRNITKGARQKLILSIQKLKARSAVLLASEHELLYTKRMQYRSKTSYSSLSQVLFQIRAFLSTPIRPLSCNHTDSSFSSFAPLCFSTCSTCHPEHESPTLSGKHLFLSSPHSVDFNNNNNSISSNSSFLSSCQPNSSKGAMSPDHNEVLLCWSLLKNEDLPDIMTRLIGHVHHILVKKCKKRLKTLNLWKENFKGIYDKLACANLPKKENFERFPDCVDNSNEQVALALDSDREENEDDEDSGLLDYNSSMILSVDGHNTTTSTNFGSLSSTPNGTEDKDSGVDEAAGDSDSGSLHSDILTVEEEEELYMVLRSVLDKCISHEAFCPHQILFRHWRQQLQCMISALRYFTVTDYTTSTTASAVDGRSVSPFTLKKLQSSSNDNYSGFYLSSRYPGCANSTAHCISPVSPAPLQQSPIGLGSKALNNAAGTFQSYKNSQTNSSINTNSNITYSKTTLSPAPPVGRRLLHSRLRSSIGGTAQLQQQLSHSTSSCMSSSSSLHHRGTSSADQQQMSSVEESTSCHAHFGEQRIASCKLNSTGKSVDSSTVIFQRPHGTSSALTYSNLSVIPQLSNALFSCAPISALNSSPNVAGNSPEVNLRNLLLQLTSQQHSQLPILQQPISPATTSPKSNITNSNSNSSSISAVNESPNSNSLASGNSLSLFDSLLADSSRTCSYITHKDNNEDGSSCCLADEHKQPQNLDNGNDNLYSLWSQVLENDDSGEARKAADWKAATGLLSSLDLCSSDGHHLEDMLNNLLDSTSDMSLTIGSWGSPAKCTASETGTTFNDIEQLCIRMAEHALEISDDSVFT